MDMSSFASFPPHCPTEAIPYPSATVSASQAPEQEQLGDALPADVAENDNSHQHHYTAAQLCVMASANSPVPPSLALKWRGLKSGVRPVEQKTSSDISNGGSETGGEEASKD